MSEQPSSLTERRRRELRAVIIDAAYAEFAERGYHQTGIADIARRAGIGHGTAYLHFKNKRDIVEHVVDEEVRRVIEALAAENAPDAATSFDEYRAQAFRIANGLATILADDPRAARLLLLEATSIDAEMTERALGLFDLGAQLVAAYFENGVRRGYFRSDLDIGPSSDAVVGMILAAALRFLRTPADAADRQRFSEAIIRLLVDGAATRTHSDQPDDELP